MKDAILSVRDHPNWTVDLQKHTPQERATFQTINQDIATQVFMKVLAARVVVFEQFLELAIQMDGHLQQKHKHAWLMFQLSDLLDPNDRNSHPFDKINITCLGGAAPDALRTLVRLRLGTIRTKYFHRDPRFFFVLDEAQVAARSSPSAFVSSKDLSKPRSILRAIIDVWVALTLPNIPFIVSGTGLSLDTVDEVFSSGVGKPAAQGFYVFHDVGSFDTKEAQRTYLDQYIPQSLLTSTTGIALCKRMLDWLRGRYSMKRQSFLLHIFTAPFRRYRFTSRFIELFLMNGLQSPHRLFNKYIEQYTDYAPLDFSDILLEHEPEVQIQVKLPETFEWAKLEQGVCHYPSLVLS